MSLCASVATAGLIFINLQINQGIGAERLEFLRSEVARLTMETKELDGMYDTLADVLARKQVAETLQRDRLHPSLVLDDLTRRRPKGLYLVSIKFGQSQAEIVGFAASPEVVDKYVRNIAAGSFLAVPQDIGSVPVAAPHPAYPIGFSFKTAVREQLAGQTQ